jgi:hypothetical protein
MNFVVYGFARRIADIGSRPFRLGNIEQVETSGNLIFTILVSEAKFLFD